MDGSARETKTSTLWWAMLSNKWLSEMLQHLEILPGADSYGLLGQPNATIDVAQTSTGKRDSGRERGAPDSIRRHNISQEPLCSAFPLGHSVEKLPTTILRRTLTEGGSLDLLKIANREPREA